MATRSFQELFSGSPEGYYLWAPTTARAASGKVKGEGRYVQGPTPPEAWEDHEAGRNSALMVSPSLPDKTALFAVIDIDPLDKADKGPQVAERAQAILSSHDLPFAVTESKSDGAHCWVFFAEPEPMHEVRRVMEHIVRSLELAKVFKCNTVDIRPTLSGTGPGASVQLPYFGEPDPDREPFTGINPRCMKLDGRYLSQQEFVDYCNTHCIVPLIDLKNIVKRQLSEIVREETQASRRYQGLEDALPDLPPCYANMVQPGVVKAGQKDNGLTHLASKLPFALPDDWEEVLRQIGYQFETPMAAGDISRVIKSRKNQAFGPLCHEPAIAQFCQKELCMKRKFGINMNALPAVAGRLKIKKFVKDLPDFESGDTPEDYVAWVELEGYNGVMQLEHRHLDSQKMFLSALHARFNIIHRFADNDEFPAMLREAYAKPGVVYFERHRPYEATPRGFLEALVKKLVARRLYAADGPPDVDAIERGFCFYHPATNEMEVGVKQLLSDIAASTRDSDKMKNALKKGTIQTVLESSRLVEPDTPVFMDRPLIMRLKGQVWRFKPRIAGKQYDDGHEGWFVVNQKEEKAEGIPF